MSSAPPPAPPPDALRPAKAPAQRSPAPAPEAAAPRPAPPRPDRPSAAAPFHPYRGAFGATLSSALIAGVVAGVADVVLTLGGAEGLRSGDSYRFATVAISLYAFAALFVGAIEGLIAGAIRATYPEGAIASAWRRMADDPALDRRVAATILAGAGAAALYAGGVAVLGMRLVADVERKAVGALLLGVAAVGVLPLFALATYPFYRVTRLVARGIPRLGPLPATVVLALLSLGAVSSFAVLFVATRLEWRALKLGVFTAMGIFVLTQGVWLALAYGPANALRRRLPGRTVALVIAILLAAGAPVYTTSGAPPSQRVVKLLTGESRGAGPLVAMARKLVDRDHDGYSALLAGPDCDDRNPAIHPNADDAVGNGIDEDCNGADALAKRATAAPGAVTAPSAPGTVAGGFAWKGNVLVIAVDTLRADRLGGGYTRRGGKSLTPRMDELTKKGVWFTHAYAQSPRTPGSFPSIFTARYPKSVKYEGNYATQNYPKLRDENVTIFEALRDGGMTTIGVSSHFYFTPERGITQGFVEYDNEGAKNVKDSNTDIAAPRIVPKVKARLTELGASKQRFAMFVHLFEPHSTYVVHEGFPYVETSFPANFEEKYDQEIAYVDRYVGEIVDAIAAAGLEKDTLIVLVSDHGEAFFQHKRGGEKLGWHGQSVYDEVLRVPMVFVVPGMEPRVVDQPVMLIDLGPTLLDLAKAPIPADFQGRSLLPAMVGEVLAPRPVYAELLAYPGFKQEITAFIDPDAKAKLIHNVSEHTYELYDLAADPDEKRDIWDDKPDLAKALKQRLAAWVDSEL